MRNTLALLLVLLLVSVPALADVLAPDWQAASIEDLTAAQELLANELSARRAAAQPSADAFTSSGTGTAILSGVQVPYDPARVTFSADSKATLTLPAKYNHVYQLYKAGTKIDFLSDPATYDAQVTAAGSWSVTIEPIRAGQTFPFTGSGAAVSDFFDLQAPTIATVSWDASGVSRLLSNLSIIMYHQYKNISRWQPEVLMNELNVDKTGSLDVILSPTQGRTEYCLVIDAADGLQWSIAYK